MMDRIKLNLIMAGLATVIVLGGVSAFDMVNRIVASSTPAIEWEGVEVVQQIVRPGDRLDIIYRAKVNKTCPADIRSFIVAEDGSVPVRYPVVLGGYTLPSPNVRDIKVSIIIPAKSDPGLRPYEPGKHVYRTIVTRYCAEGVEVDSAVPDAPFKLEVR